MPFPLDWTSPFPIRKRFLHSRGNSIRYGNILYDRSMSNVFKLFISSYLQKCHTSYTGSFCNNFNGFHFKSIPFPLRFLTLAASHLPYFLMILTTTCALLTKRCSAHLHTLRLPLPTKSTSTWESPKPSSSVPPVLEFCG